jgi:hypothetical protein
MIDNINEIATGQLIRDRLNIGRRLAYILIKVAKDEYRTERVTIDQVLIANKLKS